MPEVILQRTKISGWRPESAHNSWVVVAAGVNDDSEIEFALLNVTKWSDANWIKKTKAKLSPDFGD